MGIKRKLTDSQVSSIIALNDTPNKVIASVYGVSTEYVRLIRKGHARPVNRIILHPKTLDEVINPEADIPNSAMVKFRKLTDTKWKAEEGFTLPPADIIMGGLEYYQINGVLINKFKATSD